MTCSCSGLTEIREVLPRKSNNTQTRFWGSISSTVAMNSANGPLKSLTASPLLHFYAATACLRRRSAAWALRQEAVKVPWVCRQSWPIVTPPSFHLSCAKGHSPTRMPQTCNPETKGASPARTLWIALCDLSHRQDGLKTLAMKVAQGRAMWICFIQ